MLAQVGVWVFTQNVLLRGKAKAVGEMPTAAVGATALPGKPLSIGAVLHPVGRSSRICFHSRNFEQIYSSPASCKRLISAV